MCTDRNLQSTIRLTDKISICISSHLEIKEMKIEEYKSYFLNVLLFLKCSIILLDTVNFQIVVLHFKTIFSSFYLTFQGFC